MQEQSVSLFFTEGSSNKEYHAQLKAQDTGWVVTFQFGPRGKALKSGTKTASPLGFEAALKVYTALVAEKTRKGYTPESTGRAYQGSPLAERDSGLRPQLLNEVSPEEAERLLKDPDWVVQEKQDGERRMVRINCSDAADSIEGTNRNGLIVGMDLRVVEALAKTFGSVQAVLDTEDLGEAGLRVFDVLEMEGQDLRGQPYKERLAILDQILARAKLAGQAELVVVVETAVTELDKEVLYLSCLQRNAEGVVFKQLSAKHSPGRPASGGSWLKLKFVATASVIVDGANDGKRSVRMVGLNDQGDLVALGNVTVPANKAIPADESIIEVRYLYAYPGGSLFQPNFLRVRNDIDRSACTVSQLKYKAAA